MIGDRRTDQIGVQRTISIGVDKPGGNQLFRALSPGELFLFKLHSPRNYIVGGGVFAHSSLLPVSLAWKSFGIANGATTLQEMRSRIEQYRRVASDPADDYRIGCVLVTQPFFFPEHAWIPVPEDWRAATQQGKRYDLSHGIGAELGAQVEAALGTAAPDPVVAESVRHGITQVGERYGKDQTIRPRLGQGSFRILVTDAYERRCAFTGERVLPALEAAHVWAYAEGGPHEVENGLLLRRDLHALFDDNYLTVTPELKIAVSPKIEAEFHNGRDYYALHGRSIRVPRRPFKGPLLENLRWHNERFKG